jgi:hypothetical protein
MLAEAVVDAYIREQLGERLAAVHQSLLAGVRIDRIAEDLASIALYADQAADIVPPVHRTPIEHRFERPAFPAPPRPPSVPTRADLLEARALVLTDIGAPVIEAKELLQSAEKVKARLERKTGSGVLPPIPESDDVQLDLWERLVLHLEVQCTNLGDPFVDEVSSVAA